MKSEATVPIQAGFVAIGLLAAAVVSVVPAGMPPPDASARAGKGMTAGSVLNTIPIAFIPNAGQFGRRADASTRFFARGKGQMVGVGPKGISFRPAASRSGPLTLRVVGSRPNPHIRAEGSGRQVVSYFLGDDPSGWRPGLETYDAVRAVDVVQGVDLRVRGAGQDGGVEYDVIVHPGARPEEVRLAIDGATPIGEALRLEEDGDLQVRFDGGSYTHRKPVVYQEIGGVRHPVYGEFVVERGSGPSPTIGFKLGPYDAAHAVVIDPFVEYSSYFGGAGADQALALATDSSGAFYITGSAATGFPVTTGAFDESHNGGTLDVFVLKVNSTVTGSDDRVYCTYIGGAGSDVGMGIALDSSGNSYVTGTTTATGFPTTGGAFDTTFNSNPDGFVLKLNSTGTALTFSTYLGGTASDTAYSITVDGSNQPCVCGFTTSTNFPTSVSPAAFQSTNAGVNDIFVTRLNSTGTALSYSTYMGGTDDDRAIDIAWSSATSRLYITGSTESNQGAEAFDLTGSAFDGTFSGAQDAFIAQFDPATGGSSGLTYSSYIGGADVENFNDALGNDECGVIAVDSAGLAYIAGSTNSTDFPTSSGAYDTSRSAAEELFVAKFDCSQSGAASLIYSSYIGGDNDDVPFDVCLDANNTMYVVGQTQSTDFPVVENVLGGGSQQSANDAFVLQITPNNSGTAPDSTDLLFSTWLGGGSDDRATGVALQPNGDLAVTGFTSSTTIFPITNNAHDSSHNGSSDVFLTAINGTRSTQLPTVCYAISDTANRLVRLNLSAGTQTDIGANGTSNIECLAYRPSNQTLYAVDGTTGLFGTINSSTGAFTSIGAIGSGDGSAGTQALGDVDGLTFDPINDVCWAVARRDAADDLLFRINPSTGAFVPDQFGAGVDYVVVTGTGDLGDIDDIAFNADGLLYGIDNNGGASDQYGIIDTSTGTLSVIQTLGVNDMEGLTFGDDYTLFGTTGANSAGSDDHKVYRISRTTGATTQLFDITVGGYDDYEGIAVAYLATQVRDLKLRVYSGPNGEGILNWETGYEAKNLGFHLYREERGRARRVDESLVAGSALLSRGGQVPLSLGRSYSLIDRKGVAQRYWIECVSLDGKREMHGPYFPGADVPLRARIQESPTLAVINRAGAPQERTEDTVPRVAELLHDRARDAVQQSLAGVSALKLMVDQEGWYSVPMAELFRQGLDPRTRPQTLRLFAGGREVAVSLRGDADDRLDPSDALEFYGLPIDTIHSGRRTYWLTAGAGRGLRLPSLQSSAGGTPAAPSFPFTVERRERSILVLPLRNGNRENIFGPIVYSVPVDQELRLHHVSAEVSSATLEVAIQGASSIETDSPDHRVAVLVNGTPVGEVVFDGQEYLRRALAFPQSLLHEGSNRITLLGTHGEGDISLLDSLRLTYRRTFTAADDQLRFTAQPGQSVHLQGFQAVPRLLDVTDPDRPREIVGRSGTTGFTAVVPTGVAGARTLYAFSSSALCAPAEMEVNRPSVLTRNVGRADMVMLAHGSLLPALEPLRRLRESQGLRVLMADVQDVYDEFSFGAKDPEAIRSLLKAALPRGRAPRYLLLLGDASADPRDYLGKGAFDLLPSRQVETSTLEVPSDDWFGDLNHDDRPDVAVGRLPALTLQEATIMVGKIVDRERTGGAWKMHATLVADVPDYFPFDQGVAAVAARLPYAYSREFVNRAVLGDQAARDQVHAALQRGTGLLHYQGHGSDERWAGDILNTGDALNLANAPRYPIVVALNCLNGLYFDHSRECLATALLRSPRGGAAGVWASTGITTPAAQAAMGSAFYDRLFAGAWRVGDALVAAKRSAEHPDVRRSWVYFGDPAMRVR